MRYVAVLLGLQIIKRLVLWILLIFHGETGSALAANVPHFLLLTEDSAPLSYKQNGDFTGVAIDIISTLFNRTGIPFEIKFVPWNRAYVTAYKQKNTCFFPAERSQEREAYFHWISPILITQSGLYTRNDSAHNIRVLEDISGLTVGSYIGSALGDYIESFGFYVYRAARDELNIPLLDKKRIDVWATDTLTAAYLMKKTKTRSLSKQLVFFTVLRALACNRAISESVINKLQLELKNMYSDGTIEEIKAKYR